MKKILCFGDSNTFGYDPRDWFGGRYPETERWTGLLRQRGFEVWNRGQNGLEIPCTAYQTEAYAALIRSLPPPDAVTVMLGSNDLLMQPGFTAEDAAGRMEFFLSRLLPEAPAARWLLIAPPPMQPGDWVTEERLTRESARLAGCYAALAERLGIGFADAGAWGVRLSFDGVHFTPDGHRAFADGLQRALES